MVGYFTIFRVTLFPSTIILHTYVPRPSDEMSAVILLQSVPVAVHVSEPFAETISSLAFFAVAARCAVTVPSCALYSMDVVPFSVPLMPVSSLCSTAYLSSIAVVTSQDAVGTFTVTVLLSLS